jgi:hypothetical protein
MSGKIEIEIPPSEAEANQIPPNWSEDVNDPSPEDNGDSSKSAEEAPDHLEAEYIPGHDSHEERGEDGQKSTSTTFEGAAVPPPTVQDQHITFDTLPTALNLPHPTENISWLFDHFIERGNIVQVNYKRGTGGTWFVLDLISAATSDRKLYNSFGISGPTKSIYANSGLATDKISERISSMLDTKHLGSVKILSRSWIIETNNNDDFDLSEKKWRDIILFGIKRNPDYNLLVLDDLGTLFKSKPDAEKLYCWLYDLKQLGVTIVALCESGKGLKLPADLVDVDLNISPIEADKIKLKVEFLSARRLHKNFQEYFAIELTRDSNGISSFKKINLKKDLCGKICLLIVNGYTQAEAARLLSLNQSTVSRKFDDALNQGLVSKSGRIYKLTEKGEQITKGMKLPEDE